MAGLRAIHGTMAEEFGTWTHGSGAEVNRLHFSEAKDLLLSFQDPWALGEVTRPANKKGGK